MLLRRAVHRRGPACGNDLLLRRDERRRPTELRADRLDAIAAQDVEPVAGLAGLPGQGDPDIDMHMVREGECTGCLLTCLEVMVVGWPALVAIGRKP
jgi:hypothetical protein